MKKIFIIMTAIFVTLFLLGSFSFVGCKTATTETTTAAETTAAETTAAETTAAAIDFNETSVLNLDWESSVGTDTQLQCCYNETTLYSLMVFDTLMKKDINGSLKGFLAQSWEVSADGKTYTFTMADGVKWHDGTAFSAEDVVFSFNIIMLAPKAAQKLIFNRVIGYQDVVDGKAKTMSGVTASGNKVTVKLTDPDSSFLNNLCTVDITPSHLLRDVDPTLFDQADFWKKPIGTGPWYVDEVSFPNYFTLARNDDYFGPKVKITKVLFTSHTTGGTEAIFADAIAGNLDYNFW